MLCATSRISGCDSTGTVAQPRPIAAIRHVAISWSTAIAGSSAAVPASAATRSANTAPSSPPIVAPVPIVPTWRRAVRGSKHSLITDQNPDTRTGASSVWWR
jgi:hypothetical protein